MQADVYTYMVRYALRVVRARKEEDVPPKDADLARDEEADGVDGPVANVCRGGAKIIVTPLNKS